MATPLSKLGPGLLTFGATGSPKEFGTVVSEVKLTPDFDKDDDINVLSGDTFAGDETNTWALNITMYQTYDQESLLLWLFNERGKDVPFTFVPDKAGAVQAKGTVTLRPAEIGGEVKKKNTTELELPLVGEPTLTGSYTGTTTASTGS